MTAPLTSDGATGAQGSQEEVLLIDCQCHWYPPDVCETQLRAGNEHWTRHGDDYLYKPFAGEEWRYTREFTDLEHQLHVMGRAGVDVLLCSPSVLGDVSALEVEEARDLATQLNEAFAAAQARYPGRFYGLAVVPPQDGQIAVDVLLDAVDRLGLRGLLLHSNVNGASIASPSLEPLYETAERRGIPILLHPTRSFAVPRLTDFELVPPMAYMFDTSVAAASLILSGIIDTYPELSIVHPHLGGVLPYLANRLDVYVDLGKVNFQGSIRDYLRHFYTDTVSESPEALQMARSLYGIDRILFATDFPYFPADRGVDFVRDNTTIKDLAAIGQDNAQALLGLGGLGQDRTVWPTLATTALSGPAQ